MDIDGARRRRPRGSVTIVGAGPIGLTTALLLRRHGVDVSIIDRSTEPVSQSRATDLHPATLER
ncbi:MAG: FAD-dependent oxidoreductase, partial [Ilumatobacter sp.]